MFKCNLLNILVEVILKQAAAWFLIPLSFRLQYTWSADQPSPVSMVDHSHHILDPTIYNINRFRSFNKQFSIGPFLDREV